MSFQIESSQNIQRSARSSRYPLYTQFLPPDVLTAGRYELRFARSEADLRAVQRLRFEVFNLELGEGFESAYRTGRDEDDFDPICHHLMVVERASGDVVGTYRLMIDAMARMQHGFYSETEYDFTRMPTHVRGYGVEAGRACVHPEHRNGRVVLLLWRGLARYMDHNGKRYLFGCCSLPTLDEVEGQRVMRHLRKQGHTHPDFMLSTVPALRCGEVDAAGHDDDAPATLPSLFQGYLKLGAFVCGEPAVDRAFGVIDFFVVLDLERMEPRVRRTFLARTGWEVPAEA
jgi:putative hemolysin